MSERRHGAPLDNAHTAVSRGPLRQAPPTEFRAPSEPARERREPLFKQSAPTAVGAQMIHQNDLAARLNDADKLVERRLGIRHRGDDILRDNDIKYAVAEAEMLRVHHG